MAIDYNEIDLHEIFQDLGKICKSEKECTDCSLENCPVKYGKSCTNRCEADGVTFVEKGKEYIPPLNTGRCYDEREMLRSISHLLAQCQACHEEHYDNCVISVLRNCLEQILFGENLPYKGIPLGYMVDLSGKDEEKARIITEEYKVMVNKEEA